MTLAIVPVKKQSLATIPPGPNPEPDREAFLLAMFLLWAKCPRKAEPETDGSFWIGDVGEAPEKTWTKATPYSLARPKL